MEQLQALLTTTLLDLFQGQAKWADDWRQQVAEQVQQASRLASEASAVDGGSPSATLAAIGQFQGQWLAMTRGWIDAMGAAKQDEVARR